MKYALIIVLFSLSSYSQSKLDVKSIELSKDTGKLTDKKGKVFESKGNLRDLSMDYLKPAFKPKLAKIKQVFKSKFEDLNAAILKKSNADVLKEKRAIEFYIKSLKHHGNKFYKRYSVDALARKDDVKTLGEKVKSLETKWKIYYNKQQREQIDGQYSSSASTSATPRVQYPNIFQCILGLSKKGLIKNSSMLRLKQSNNSTSFLYNFKGQGVENEEEESLIHFSINDIKQYKFAFRNKSTNSFAVLLSESPEVYMRVEHKNTKSYINKNHPIKVLKMRTRKVDEDDKILKGENFDFYQNKFLQNVSKHIQASLDSFEKAVQFDTKLVPGIKDKIKKLKYDKSFRTIERHCRLLDPKLAKILKKKVK